MSEQPKRFLCRHIHAVGLRCGSPCLRGEQFCYFHHTSRRPALPNRPAPGAYISPDHAFELPLLEDRAAVQLAIGEVARRIAANQLDPTRARLLIATLKTASANLPRERPEPARPAARHSYSAPVEEELVEELIVDPNLGPLAPEAAEAEEDQEEDVSHLTGVALARKMLENIHKRRAKDKCPVCHPETWPHGKAQAQSQASPGTDSQPRSQPGEIPMIQASAERKPFTPNLPRPLKCRPRQHRTAPRLRVHPHPFFDTALPACQPKRVVQAQHSPWSSRPADDTPPLHSGNTQIAFGADKQAQRPLTGFSTTQHFGRDDRHLLSSTPIKTSP